MNKHITRDYSAHRKSVIRPYDEFVKLEIFSYDHQYTKTYLYEDGTLTGSSNCSETSWKSWSCFKSEDGQNPMVFDIDYSVKENGEYRFDVIFEHNDVIYGDERDTSDFLLGNITIKGEDGVILDYDAEFDGVNNVIKRISVYQHLNEGDYTVTFKVPHNCYCMGFIIRKLKVFIGDNYYGSALGSEEGNMALLSANWSKSGMVKPSELSCDVALDDDFECELSPSGFFIDYMDEVNYYIKDNNREVVRVFGGYISSILPNSDRTQLTINCADRLSDGTNKYLLDQMVMQGGTKSNDDVEYNTGMSRDFENYPQALDYLSHVHEQTLKSNISKNYTVDGENYRMGLQLTFGSEKNIKNIPSTHQNTVEVNPNFIMLRNDSIADKEQIWTLYKAEDYAKLPIDITESPYMHITYGLGEPKTEIKTTTTETVDNADTTAGSQTFSKCGVSKDGKYLMAIGLPSAGKDPKKGWTKTIFKRKCPHCGSTNLIWDWNWGSGKACNGRYEGGSTEGHIFCITCDADYSVQGYEHISGSKYHMEKVGSTSTSSKAEAQKLKSGGMSGVVGGGETVLTPADVFKAITKIAFKYKYRLGSTSTYSAMKKSGTGDCWAFSDLIYTEMKKYKVSVKVVQYATNYASNHRSVLYKDAKGNWQDFPYREYGWGTQFNNMLNNTADSKNGATIQEYKGNDMSNINGVTNTSSTQTTTVTTTTGYDKDKPFQAYLRLTYSFEQSWDAVKHDLYIKFTQPATDHEESINSGVNLYWINDVVKKVRIDKDLITFIRTIYDDEELNVYLHGLEFIAPIKDSEDDNTWFKFDDSTQDFSSCKIQLYQIFFDNENGANPSDLNSCGKTVNSMMEEIVKLGGYIVDMSYGLHRKDDVINYRINNNTSESYTASEGDNNNILQWNSISYNPLNSMYNMSMQVFKQKDNKYYYIDTKDSPSILEYGEQMSLNTTSDTITTKEAYFNAVMSDKYYPFQQYSYSITVPNFPNLQLGNLVKVIANAKKLNDVKEVQSIKVVFDYAKMPRIQTTIGLDELDPDAQLKENIRELRRNSKKESTAFSSTATPITDKIYYEWDR